MGFKSKAKAKLQSRGTNARRAPQKKSGTSEIGVNCKVAGCKEPFTTIENMRKHEVQHLAAVKKREQKLEEEKKKKQSPKQLKEEEKEKKGKKQA